METPSSTSIMLIAGHSYSGVHMPTHRCHQMALLTQCYPSPWLLSNLSMPQSLLVHLFNKNTNCHNLGKAITNLIGYKVSFQFKTIHAGPQTKQKASMVHIMADESNDSVPIMAKLNKLYREKSMANWVADYMLNQRLLLVLITKGLSDNNLTAQQKLKTKQATFWKLAVTVSTLTVCKLDKVVPFSSANRIQNWSLRSLLMQVAHLKVDTCAFFQAIDNYLAGIGVAFTMLPSAAPYHQNMVLGTIPFTRLLLEHIYGKT